MINQEDERQMETMTTESRPTGEPPASPRPVRDFLADAWGRTRHFRPVLALLIALSIFFTITQPVFSSGENLENLGTSVAQLWVMAIGMTFVLLSGGVDLSVGAISALLGIFLAKVLGAGVPGGVAIILVILAGAAVGAGVNGVMIGTLRMSFFVATLASMTAITGVVNLWSDTQSFFITAPVVSEIGVGDFLGVPIPIWIMAGMLALGLFVQRRTYFGRDVYAVGGSTVAARLSGIRTSRTLVAVYGLSGACAGLATIIGVGRIGSASPTVDGTISLQAIAAVMLGGTGLAGGAGGVGGSALGVLFIGTLQNGLGLAGVPSFWQQVVTGVILAAAVLVGRMSDTGGVRRIWRGFRRRRSVARLAEGS